MWVVVWVTFSVFEDRYIVHIVCFLRFWIDSTWLKTQWTLAQLYNFHDRNQTKAWFVILGKRYKADQKESVRGVNFLPGEGEGLWMQRRNHLYGLSAIFRSTNDFPANDTD